MTNNIDGSNTLIDKQISSIRKARFIVADAWRSPV